ncbi:MAG TPA: hypothetical protein VFT43_10675 [Candidatus Polarisedimenticolia bacterium]|nr:hypothetical protein [Candidatus Polarisedimenticolia bacterium]
MANDARDIYQRFEAEVRAPARRLLLDAFLPSPETLASAVAPPPPLPMPEPSADEMGAFARLEAEEPVPPPKPKAKKKRAVPPKKEAPKSLQDEVAEFMNRDQTALSPEDDLDSFLNSSLAPDVDPDPKPDPESK